MAIPGLSSDGQPVTITELRPPFRVMTFAGKDRPEQPVVVGSEQRATQTHYPGTQKASVQFMGTKRDDIVLRGWFHDPLSLIDGGPKAREELLRGLEQGGNLCQLVWGYRIICQGRVKRTQFEYHTELRVRYEVTFAVDQGNEPVALLPVPVGLAVAAQIAQQMRQIVAAAGVAVDAVRTVKVLGGVVR